MHTFRAFAAYAPKWHRPNQASRGAETKNKHNWVQYNQSLVNRGDITSWFSGDVLKFWNHPNHDCRRGRPFVYSDTAIEPLLVTCRLLKGRCSGYKRFWKND
ncbi:MAG: transposase [Thermoguttaceae bacterium]|nr:transposase [Thermoguttaceae bacterium]